MMEVDERSEERKRGREQERRGDETRRDDEGESNTKTTKKGGGRVIGGLAQKRAQRGIGHKRVEF
jgi:hypothetical protein